MRETRLGTQPSPEDKREHRAGEHRRDEPARDGIGHPLDRRATALGRADHLHDARKQRFVADFFRAHEERTRAVDRASRDRAGDRLRHGNGLTRDHRFVDHARAFQHRSVDRNLFAWTHAEMISGVDLIERHIFLLAL